MTGRSFEESFRILKSLVSEIADPTMRTTGNKLRVNPNAAEQYHRMNQGKRDRRADEIAEENMTPNMVINEKMSRRLQPVLGSHELDLYQDDRYQNKRVPPEIQIGHMVSDSQNLFHRNQLHEMPAPLSFAEVQQMQGSGLQGPLPYEQIRQFPNEPTNPFKLKSSPFDLAWTILKGDDVLEPIRQRQRLREQEPFNPFTVRPPSTPPPMREERSLPMGGTEGMSRGPMRSRKRGNPASSPRFIRPGFRSTEAMPLTDESAEYRMEL